MALSTQQQQDIVYYLGWPGKTLLQGSTHYNSVVASRLINLIPEIENQANALVCRIKKIDEVLQASICRMSTLEVQDIKLDPAESAKLRRERRIILSELSDLLDIDVIKRGGVNVGVTS